jgi:uncharacterized protein YbcI
MTGEEPLRGGQLLTAISTTIVGILRQHYGRGPMKAKTYALDDIVVVVMRGSGFTPLEKTIMDSGNPDRVVEMRHDFQRVMAALQPGDPRADQSQVVAFLSQAHVDPDITMEIFFVDRPLDGFGAVEVIEPGLPRRGLLSRDAPSESPRAAELRSYVVSRAPRQAVPSREEKGAPRSDWRCRRRMRTRRRAEAADSESRAHLGSRARSYFPTATVLER